MACRRHRRADVDPAPDGEAARRALRGRVLATAGARDHRFARRQWRRHHGGQPSEDAAGSGLRRGHGLRLALPPASTYALGQVFIKHFSSGGTFLTFDFEKAKSSTKRSSKKASSRPSQATPASNLRIEEHVALPRSCPFDRPIGYFRLNEPSGGAAKDSSGKGNHGAIRGSVKLGEEGPFAGGAAASFDGTGFIEISSGKWGGRARDHRGSVDQRQRGAADFQSVVASTGTEFLHLQLHTEGNLAIYTNIGYVLLPILPQAPLSVWRHVALSVAPANVQLYVDGALVSSSQQKFSKIKAASAIRIGGRRRQREVLPGPHQRGGPLQPRPLPGADRGPHRGIEGRLSRRDLPVAEDLRQRQRHRDNRPQGRHDPGSGDEQLPLHPCEPDRRVDARPEQRRRQGRDAAPGRHDRRSRMDNALWTRATLSSHWVQVPNSTAVMDVTQLQDGRIVGVGMDNMLWTRPALAGSWTQVPNSAAIKP